MVNMTPLLLLLLLICCSRAQNGYLEEIPGEPGVDYSVLGSVPQTSFSCDGRVSGGYYADIETNCQVNNLSSSTRSDLGFQAFHVCVDSGSAYYGLISYSFLCPNGTMFHQKYFICDWWYNVDCRASVDFYDLNNNLFKVRVSSAS